MFDVNLKSIFLCSKTYSQRLAKQGGGRTINIASNAGKVGFPNQADYNASKVAVINLTRSLAEELAPMGIAVRFRSTSTGPYRNKGEKLPCTSAVAQIDIQLAWA
jgi:NAD(P)-dependent dehydrogenase (short-subunit alcohol dehydrogenase family)